MKKIKLNKKRIFMIYIIALILLMFLNPLSRSTEVIRADMLKYTPIGSTSEEVMEFIEKKYKNKDITPYEGGGIGVCIGEYRGFSSFIFMTYVEVVWHFAEDDTLECISVKKDTDSL